MRNKTIGLLFVMALAILPVMSVPAETAPDPVPDEPEKIPVRALILPKFEVEEMTGDFPGEAQLFYNEYCKGCGETEIPNMPPTGRFFVNEENGVGLLISGSGKTAASLTLSAVLSSGLYDFSDTYIISVGCGGQLRHA